MRLLSINNDHNIGRVVPKMNDNFQYESDAKLIDSRDCLAYVNQSGSYNNSRFEFTDFTENDKVYCNYADNEEVSSSNANCHPSESEVKSLKEWLVLHNDLIQQQNEEILEKEHQIYVLQRENEMLKERLLCIEKGVPYQPAEQHPIVADAKNTIPSCAPEDMTQDSCNRYEQDSKEDLGHSLSGEDVVICSLEVTNHQANPVCDAESQVGATTTVAENTLVDENEYKSDEYIVNDLSDSFKTESDPTECTKDSLSEYNFTVNNFCEFDPMKNIRMSIRRKRISSSSVLSLGEQPVLEENKTLRRAKKKRLRLGKDVEILATKEPYCVSQANEDAGDVKPEGNNLAGNANLEVPRWRVKVYTSCYTMEGTENLDDEVYNKRHLRLEIDERRRKRWDVQRIREQRVIDKLKQRQDRIANNGSKGEVDQDLLCTFWPKTDDVKYVEMVDELPVSAFGHPIPQVFFKISNFSLPWLNNPAVVARSNSKRSTGAVRRRSRNRR